MMETLIDLSAGNPGAVSVLVQLRDNMPLADFTNTLVFMDQNNIKGPQIWMLYKDWQHQNIADLVDKFVHHSDEVMNYINTDEEVQYYRNRS